MIRKGNLELVTSYVLDYENDRNRSLQKKMTIERVIREYKCKETAGSYRPVSQCSQAEKGTGCVKRDNRLLINHLINSRLSIRSKTK